MCSIPGLWHHLTICILCFMSFHFPLFFQPETFLRLRAQMAAMWSSPDTWRNLREQARLRRKRGGGEEGVEKGETEERSEGESGEEGGRGKASGGVQSDPREAAASSARAMTSNGRGSVQRDENEDEEEEAVGLKVRSTFSF